MKNQIITFSSLKGGVGKTSIALLVSRALYSLGKKVCYLDMDIQNAGTFSLGITSDVSEKKNIAKALFEGDLLSNVVESESGIFVIPSSLDLVKLRSANPNELKRLINPLREQFDYIIIETSPTLDNIVFNALNCSDLVITPVNMTQFDWKTALFFKSYADIELGDNFDKKWKILYNKFEIPRTNSKDSEAYQYRVMFEDSMGDYLLETEIPRTSLVRRAIDALVKITKAKAKIKLYNAINNLILEITDIKNCDQGAF